jgi:hypothetical protein
LVGPLVPAKIRLAGSGIAGVCGRVGYRDEAGEVFGWEVEYNEDNDDTNSAKELQEQGYTLPEYQFVVRYGRLNDRSNVLNVKGWVDEILKNGNTGSLLPNRKYTVYLPDGGKRKGNTDANGVIAENNLPVGGWCIQIHDGEE